MRRSWRQRSVSTLQGVLRLSRHPKGWTPNKTVHGKTERSRSWMASGLVLRPAGPPSSWNFSGEPAASQSCRVKSNRPCKSEVAFCNSRSASFFHRTNTSRQNRNGSDVTGSTSLRTLLLHLHPVEPGSCSQVHRERVDRVRQVLPWAVHQLGVGGLQVAKCAQC
jgi:hypothetical protein